ncbi:MAG: class II fumarate hydratase [Terriglobales bacterium]
MLDESQAPVVVSAPSAAPALRRERDSMGDIEVPADRLWGAQTQRSLQHFSIGGDRMPHEIYHAYGYIKQAAARVNQRAGRLDAARAEAIARAAAEAAAGQLDQEFPLYVWQTGSGTQTNMNVNEVMARRAAQLAATGTGPIHPNDHVNLAQSSNDTFPTATHLAAVLQLQRRLLPPLEALAATVEARSTAWMAVVKIGRTHLQDAVPLTVGQEWSGYAAQLRANIAQIRAALPGLRELAAGGTAVGTGLNSPPGFGEQIAAELAALTGEAFVSAANKFAALAGADAMVAASGAVRGAAAALAKIANDIRFLGSGPRCGLGELVLPANEPGSSIMPGKVNPTQCEAMLMVCAQVIGEDAIIANAATQGNFELNTMRPLIAYNFLHATGILADAARNFRVFCIEGIELNQERIGELVARSLMLVTALTPAIGYDKAAKIAHDALERHQTLREAAVASGWISGAEFDRLVVPAELTRPR